VGLFSKGEIQKARFAHKLAGVTVRNFYPNSIRLMMSFQANIGSTKSSFVAFKKKSLSSIESNLRNVKIAKNDRKWRKSRNGSACD
jgi:hypothetical protein